MLKNYAMKPIIPDEVEIIGKMVGYRNNNFILKTA